MRPIVDERGPGGYTPMLYDILARGSWKEYREALEAEWLPYVQGKRSLEEAATGLLAALKRAKELGAPKPPGH